VLFASVIPGWLLKYCSGKNDTETNPIHATQDAMAPNTLFQRC
jgi:hypothetical protein